MKAREATGQGGGAGGDERRVEAPEVMGQGGGAGGDGAGWRRGRRWGRVQAREVAGQGGGAGGGGAALRGGTPDGEWQLLHRPHFASIRLDRRSGRETLRVRYPKMEGLTVSGAKILQRIKTDAQPRLTFTLVLTS